MYHVLDEKQHTYLKDNNGNRLVMSENAKATYEQLKKDLGVENLRRLKFEVIPEYDLVRHISTYGGGANHND